MTLGPAGDCSTADEVMCGGEAWLEGVAGPEDAPNSHHLMVNYATACNNDNDDNRYNSGHDTDVFVVDVVNGWLVGFLLPDG